MSFSDCAKCWDTPCNCGNEGYVVIYDKRLREMSREDFHACRKHLDECAKAYLDKEQDK